MSKNSELFRANNVGFSVSGWRTSRQILKGISCSMKKGTFNVILGSNGAGKTTFLRILTGLLQPDTGAVTFCGNPVTDEHRYRIGYVSENERLPKALTPEEVLQFRARAFSMKGIRPETMKFCRDFGLTSFFDQKISGLSPGQKRRLAWAAAILPGPEALILDEPFTGLDPPGRERLITWLHDFHKTGKTVILCTHDLNLIPKYFHQMLIFSGGKICFSGDHSGAPDKKEILAYYRH